MEEKKYAHYAYPGALYRYEMDVTIEPYRIPIRNIGVRVELTPDQVAERLRDEQADSEGNKTMKEKIHLNYSQPIITGYPDGQKQWSVFVRKYKCDTQSETLLAVAEHKFLDLSDAETFAKNNWNLGDYF